MKEPKTAVTIPMTIEIGDAQQVINLRVEGTYHPSRRAYTPRGEYGPIDPPEPASFEYDKIFVVGDPALSWLLKIVLSEDMLDAIEDCALGLIKGGDYEDVPDPDRAYDARFTQRREASDE